MLFILPAPNVYEAQGRVAGHKHTPTSRESLKLLKPLVPRLRELGVSKIICSDLDIATGSYLARRLNIPVEEWQSLRRFNVGKLHGTDQAKFSEVYAGLQSPEVPVKGGDSKASFDKRVAHSKHRLRNISETILVICEAKFLGVILEPYHIYDVELGTSHESLRN